MIYVKRKIIFIIHLILIYSAIFISCTTNKAINIEDDIDDFYQYPSLGLKSFNKAVLNETNKIEIRSKIGDYNTNDELLQKICLYLKNEYKSAEIVDGANMRYSDEIIRTKTIRHCAEYGVIWLSILRLYQIPCIYIQAMKLKMLKKKMERVGEAMFLYVHILISNLY